jgi:hypothetical protein
MAKFKFQRKLGRILCGVCYESEFKNEIAASGRVTAVKCSQCGRIINRKSVELDPALRRLLIHLLAIGFEVRFLAKLTGIRREVLYGLRKQGRRKRT